ncbi:uncharacterized protein SOCEGT47_071060 [Sorangium cellulosum]|uniref:Secreted protein n=2 Tax=Sorangium cellulosum TaxID=56 RepID=A0A4P2QB63_SORCE|nr:uncharacterized protein SOCEGT47_071060 [Sorangium cellulosum]
MTLRHPLARTALAALTGVALAAAGVAALAEPPRPPPRAGYAPDPAALPSAKHWVFEVLHTKGKSSISRARPVVLARPAATARLMGRFAIELYVGTELLDRVRFDVPLTGDAPERSSGVPRRRPTFDEGVTTRLRVQMADNPRASWAKLVDRKTGVEQRFLWPPEPDGRLLSLDARRPAALDGGTPADAGWPPGDAGRPPADGGKPPADAGWPPADAGWPPGDAGRPPADGGKPPADAGWPPADAGWPSVDAGWTLDAGRPRGK